MSHLALSLLGSFQVVLNGQPVTGFDYDKVRALLIFLMMERERPHRRDALAEMLWPDQAHQVGRDSLRQALSKLRQAIGDHQANPPFLLINRETLQFNADSHFTLDCNDFTALIDLCQKHAHRHITTCAACAQRLHQAAELYRGSFVEHLVLRDSDSFEDWASLKRTQFQTQALEVLSNLTQYHQQCGEFDLARRYGWRQIELEPWREEAYQQLMQVLASSGQRSAALAQYERCCQILDEEFGVLPSPETTAIYEQIREHASAYEIVPAPTPIIHGLPTLPTSFVGRETELEQLRRVLADPTCRLLTVIGLGGMGKTRLALEAVRQSALLFEGSFFVPLAALNSADLLAVAIADALQFSTVNQDDFAAQLINYLSDKNFLLTLDNMEHLTEGVGLLAEIMARAPGIKLLITSRERLSLAGEWVLPLRGLPSAISAADLFVQRVRMIKPDFVAVMPDILRICELVDGMPLAIELAAAWSPLLTCQQIAESIASDLAFLTASGRDLPERHQSLRRVFEYSWKLLPLEQQRIFMALSVFRGGFQVDAALEVSGASLSDLLVFMNKSILRRTDQDRYEIHELLRQYALEKLLESEQGEQVFSRHLEFFAQLVETAEAHLQVGQQTLWLERLEAEYDNLRAALEWSLRAESAETGLRLATALWFFSHLRHNPRENLEWLEKLLAAAPDATPLLRAKALYSAGWLAQSNRDLTRGMALTKASLELAREIGDQRSIAYPLSTLAWLGYFQGDYDTAVKLGEESLTLFREVNDPWGIVHTLNILGFIAESQADYARAELLQREGVIIARGSGDNDSLALSLGLLGRVVAEHGHYDQAIAFLTEALEIYRELRNRWGIAASVYTLAEFSLARRDFDQAAARAQESASIMREMSDFWAIGGPLHCLGVVAYHRGAYDQANTHCHESLIYFRRIGDKRGMAYALDTLGMVAKAQGKFKQAVTHFKECLDQRRQAGIQRGVEVCLEQLAEIATIDGNADRAACLYGAAAALRDLLGTAPSEVDLERSTRHLEAVRQQLGDSAFSAAWSRGQASSIDAMIAYALAPP